MFLSLICRHQTVGKTDCNAVGFCSVTGCHVTFCVVYFGQFTGSTAWFRLKQGVNEMAANTAVSDYEALLIN
jgi:hypothetical protein